MHCHWSLFQPLSPFEGLNETEIGHLESNLRYDTICAKPHKKSTTYHYIPSPLPSIHINRNFFDSMCNPLHQTRQNIIKIKTQIQTKNAPMRSQQTYEKGKQEKIRKEPAWLAAHCSTAEKKRIQIFFRGKKNKIDSHHEALQTNAYEYQQKSRKKNLTSWSGFGYMRETLQIPSYENNPFACWIRWWCCEM